MSSPLAELKAACKPGTSVSDVESIKHGVSTWFHGLPASASPGTVALSIGGDAKVIINEGDIRSAEKVGDLYRVEVSADAHFILRIDKLMKATVTHDCGCGKDHPQSAARAGVIARQRLPTWTMCERLCASITIAGITFWVCIDVNCIILDPNLPPESD